MTKFDTKDWKLSATIGYVLKPHASGLKKCDDCGGKGKSYVRGWYPAPRDDEDQIDSLGYRTCSTCNGTGDVWTHYKAEPQPELPRGLVEALRATLEGHEEPPSLEIDFSQPFYRR